MTTSTEILTVSLALVRTTPTGPELFWARRCADRDFLAGFHAFFAGSVESNDDDLKSAAMRECFEECGLIFTGDGIRTIPVEKRIPETLAQTGVQSAQTRLEHLGWWTTPQWLSTSFSTAFFGLLLTESEGQKLDRLSEELDPDEFDEGWWISPRDALQQWWEGRAFITTPIRSIIESLADGSKALKSLPAPDRLGPTRTSAGTSQTSQICGGTVLAPLRTLTLPPATHTNAIIAGDRQFVVIDPGAPDEGRLAPLLEHLEKRAQQGDQCMGIVLTHHHRDHVGGLELLSHHLDAPILAHPETLRRLGRLPLPTQKLVDGQHIKIDHPGPLRAIYTPGHAPGHFAFFQRDTKLLFAGDMMASQGTIIIDPPEGDMGDYLRSLRRLRKLRPRTVLCAHGPLVTTPLELIDHYLEHRQVREEKVLDALREQGPATAKKLVPHAYDDAPPEVWPLAERSLLAHLQHLQKQGLATQDDDRFVALPL